MKVHIKIMCNYLRSGLQKKCFQSFSFLAGIRKSIPRRQDKKTCTCTTISIYMVRRQILETDTLVPEYSSIQLMLNQLILYQAGEIHHCQVLLLMFWGTSELDHDVIRLYKRSKKRLMALPLASICSFDTFISLCNSMKNSQQSFMAGVKVWHSNNCAQTKGADVQLRILVYFRKQYLMHGLVY